MTDPCLASGEITAIKVSIGKIETTQANISTMLEGAFSRFQARVDDHECRIRGLEKIAEALGQIESTRAEVAELKAEITAQKTEIAALKTSDTVRSFWEGKTGQILMVAIAAAASALATLLIARWM
jgi:hypothetical protein